MDQIVVQKAKHSKKLLFNFAYNNEELERLESKLSEFNPFKVLKAERYEIRHSNFLAWLLDPYENHLIGDYFLKKFLKEVLLGNEEFAERHELMFNTDELLSLELGDMEVRREWHDIDILLISHRFKLLILIENKVGASESRGQLNKYLDICRSEFPAHDTIPVFLTLYGDEPSNSEYALLSYEEIYRLLKFSRDIWSGRINQKVIDFITYYIKILEVLLMKDEELSMLCKKIYAEHKEAIDLIKDYTEKTDYEGAVKIFFDAHTELEQLGWTSNQTWFLPKKLKEKLPNNMMERWGSVYPVSIWFWLGKKNSKFGVVLEIGPFKDQEKRVKLLNHLKNNGVDVSDWAMEHAGETRYTRLSSKYKKFEEWDDEKKLGEELIWLYQDTKWQNEIKKIFEVVESFDFR